MKPIMRVFIDLERPLRDPESCPDCRGTHRFKTEHGARKPDKKPRPMRCAKRKV